ncbi:inorganic phosphate transporter [Sphingomonas sp. 28-63-12]|uniref:inorganic phosphate transporter n=1 Tax=Sphingomonas sp. 28-63-12 TaxID=1970434 RepID=UPI000BD1BDE0|nr:MAG: anion permease [Sphingomonas sp. 28-63-12]
MASNSFQSDALPGLGAADRPALDTPVHPLGSWLFLLTIIGGLGYAGYSIANETAQVGETLTLITVVFLGVALLIALGFEFVNGFHDTANAVATVIYTNSMPARFAVVWSGFFNLLGVLLSSGAVAYSIVSLLPVELILNVGSGAGFAMIFALLIAAIVWNLATWFVGLPNSSSHALIGSILGVGFANQLLSSGTGGTSGVDWSQAQKILTGLAMAPVIGFFGAMLLLFTMRMFLRNPKLYAQPSTNTPPPRGIRALLIFTCTAVSFAHGGNDGQKGMGLIMLILIGCAPTAYALNRDLPGAATPALVQQASAMASVFHAKAGSATVNGAVSRDVLASALKTKSASDPVVYAALDSVSSDIGARLGEYGALANVPASATSHLRTDMYLVLDTTKIITKSKAAHDLFSEAELSTISGFQKGLEGSTHFIPIWVKVAVAIALGLGTMVGWKRIVVTVGEKIGKSHMTYGMGGAAELTAAAMILLADRYGLPVSTTHILSSGVAGANVASGAGLQGRTIRNMALAWILTLPAVMALSGGLYWAFLTLVQAMGTA